MDFDYQELVVVASKKANNIFTYDIGKDAFYATLNKVKTTSFCRDFKFYQNDIVETRHGNIQRLQYFQDGKVKETKLYDVRPVQMTCEGNMANVKFHRQKLPDVMFPSSMTYDSVKHLRRFTFRINNRLFLNFQIEQGSKICYKVFLNFNNGKDIENTDTLLITDKIIKLITSVSGSTS